MKTKECSNLSKWKEKVLEHCQAGINEVNTFIELHPEYFFPGLEQIKQEFYGIVDCLK